MATLHPGRHGGDQARIAGGPESVSDRGLGGGSGGGNRRLLSELPLLPVCEGPAGAAPAASPDGGTGGQVERTDCPPVPGGEARAALGAA